MELRRREDGSVEALLPPNFPFLVSSCEGQGRCLVAKRDIEPNEVVLSDSAVIIGPASERVCVVCCAERSLVSCGVCRFPVCSSCTGSGQHDLEECCLLAKVGGNSSPPMYNILLPLRFGLLKRRDADMFDWLLQYQDHTVERRETRGEELRNSTDRMAAIVSAALNIPHPLAVRLIGVLFTNCFEFRVRNVHARALYPLISLINHSCVPNLRHVSLLEEVQAGDLTGEIVVMQLEAQRPVKAGNQLNIRYSQYTQGHLERRKFLWEQWFFQCRCPRCVDPTEFGTKTSGLPCPGCKTGLLLPQVPQSSDWLCEACGRCEPESWAAKRESELMAEANAKPLPFNVTTSLRQLHSLTQQLGPSSSHFVLMDLKERFLFSFSMNMKKVRDLSREQREKLLPLFIAQEKYCKQLLTYHEVLDPGKSQIKTKLLLELRKILLIQCKVLCEREGESDKKAIVEKLGEVKGLSSLVFTTVPL